MPGTEILLGHPAQKDAQGTPRGPRMLSSASAGLSVSFVQVAITSTSAPPQFTASLGTINNPRGCWVLQPWSPRSTGEVPKERPAPFPALAETAFGKRARSKHPKLRHRLGKGPTAAKAAFTEKQQLSSEDISLTISVYGWWLFEQLKVKQDPFWACSLPQTNHIHGHANCPLLSHLK